MAKYLPRRKGPEGKRIKTAPEHVATPYREARTPEGRRAMEARLVAARQFTATVEDGRASFADMLSRLWRQASDTLQYLEGDRNLPLKTRLDAIGKVAKIMPLLSKAERTHVTMIGGVAVEDMSSAQLAAAVEQITQK